MHACLGGKLGSLFKLQLHKKEMSMKLNLDYCGKKSHVEIPYREIERCEVGYQLYSF